jgi:hypothetical protein
MSALEKHPLITLGHAAFSAVVPAVTLALVMAGEPHAKQYIPVSGYCSPANTLGTARV